MMKEWYEKLSSKLQGYEERPQQVEFSELMDQCLDTGKHAMIEAPCGVGKSIGYLIPAIKRLAQGKKVVIATSTIALQEQLMGKDIPFLHSIFDIPFTFYLLKGKGNYFCKDRFRKYTLTYEENEYTNLIGKWSSETSSGDITEFPENLPNGLKMEICGDQDDCDHCKARNCFYYQARMRAHASDIIIVNYHLLFTHFKIGGLLLPKFDILVCDEGHNIPDIARDFFGWKLTRFGMQRCFNHLSDYMPRVCKQAREKIQKFFRKLELHENLLIRNPLKFNLKDLQEIIEIGLKASFEFLDYIKEKNDKEEMQKGIKKLETLKKHLTEVNNEFKPRWVYWLDKKEESKYVSIMACPVHVEEQLNETLFKNNFSTLVTSATLSVRDSFNYIEKEIGIENHKTLILPSPFDFKNQCMLLIREHGNTREREFRTSLSNDMETLYNEIPNSKILGIFTSKESVKVCKDRLGGKGYNLFVQYEGQLTNLITQFKEEKHAILLGTMSLWEGVDIHGLTHLVIDKLPFMSPEDPIVKYKIEHEDEEGNCFYDYMLPRAVLTLKQGFGRAIRNKNSKVAVIIGDQRLKGRNTYKDIFMDSLPECCMGELLSDTKTFID